MCGTKGRWNDPKYLRDRAEELRSVADDFKSDARERLLQCANDYELLAERAEERESHVCN